MIGEKNASEHPQPGKAPSGQTGGASYWLCGKHRLDYRRRPLVMGILNITPDSFHAASRVESVAAATTRAVEMAIAGADLLDIGAESSRPGAMALDVDTEKQRLIPILEAVRTVSDLPITVDTYNADTAAAALSAGADGINDISAGTFDPQMLSLASEMNCGLILMHRLGPARTMQDNPEYEDVVQDIRAYLMARSAAALAAGVRPEQIAIDPGIGFGKTLRNNLDLLASLEVFSELGSLMLGASRKSFIGKLTGAGAPVRLGGSLAAASIAMSAGAAIVRVHDVADTVQMLEVIAAITESGNI